MLVAHPSAQLYGSDRILLESVSAMVSRGWRVVVTVPAAGPLVAELEACGARVVLCRSPVIRKQALAPRGMARLVWDALRSVGPSCRLIVGSQADGIYVNTLTIPTWLVLGRLLGRPVTCHVHEAEGSASALIRRLIALPLVFASRIIVNSAFSLEVLTGAIPLLAQRATVVYNGVRGPAEPQPARAELTGQVRMLFIGRLSPRKGPQVAIDATAQLRARGVDARLDLLGDVFEGYEWFEAELRATVARCGLDGAVRFLGFEPDVWPAIANADLVLVPSVADEPFGNTAVEAVLGARPLVVSATSGLREAAAGFSSAVLVEPDRPDQIADAVEEVVADWDDYRRAAWSDSALAHDRYSVARYREQLIELLSHPSLG
jgi:glycosyltransferase involved in cell wall biosynthesis